MFPIQGRISIANNTNIDTLLAARMNGDETIQPPKEGKKKAVFRIRFILL